MNTTRTRTRVLSHPQLRDNDAPLLFDFTGSSRYVPLLAGAGLFVVAMLLSLFGPIDWQMDNAVEVYGLLTAYLVAMVAGYWWAVRRKGGRPVGGRWPLPQASAIVVVGSVLYLVLYPLTVYDATGQWFPNVVQGLLHPGQAYAAKTAAELAIPQYAVYLGTLVAPLTIAVLPLTLFFWPRLSPLARGLGVATILMTLALGVARAVNQDVGDLCGYIVLFLVLVASTSRVGRGRWKRSLTCLAGAVLVAGLFLGYYHTVISGRVETDAVTSGQHRHQSLNDAMRNQALVSLGTTRTDSVFYTVVPTAAQPTGSVFTSYLTQGYKGLSLALDATWHPTYGLGFSTFVRHNVSRVLGLDENAVEARTYEGQVSAEGWTAGVQWSTFFIHPASDLTFLGVIPLMVLIGFAFGSAWRDTCTRADPVACVVFFYLGIQVLYLSANNQLYEGGRLAVGFTVALVAWLLLRVRRPRVHEPDRQSSAVRSSVGAPAVARGDARD
ncbi:hypothetical protein [Nocardioides cynanchi]|uniref:hypothetical protein n=1 Tax=Nocardioides cynanchi TaxID=2558918 RepID=UPI00124700D5|nr:hypothetical protein [Nocardioides cynanchi]